MKITIWIRQKSDTNSTPVIRIEPKYENVDTPAIGRMGRKLLKALGWEDEDSAD